MKAISLLLVVLFAVSCSSASSTSTPTSLEYMATGTPLTLEPKAVYFVQGEGVLSQDDLNAHPEVLVVHSLEDFKKHTQTKIALWIDKNAVDLFREQPLCDSICKYWPVVLVGYSDPVYSFHDVLFLDSMFEGPPASYTRVTKDPNSIEPGFSVWILLVDTEDEKKAWNPGFPGTPTVHNILDITNPLLEEKIPDSLEK